MIWYESKQRKNAFKNCREDLMWESCTSSPPLCTAEQQVRGMSARGPEFAPHKEAERGNAEEGKTEGKKAIREVEGQTDYLRKGKIKRDHIQRGKRRDSWRFQVHLSEGEGSSNANKLEERGLGKGANPHLRRPRIPGGLQFCLTGPHLAAYLPRGWCVRWFLWACRSNLIIAAKIYWVSDMYARCLWHTVVSILTRTCITHEETWDSERLRFLFQETQVKCNRAYVCLSSKVGSIYHATLTQLIEEASKKKMSVVLQHKGEEYKVNI